VANVVRRSSEKILPNVMMFLPNPSPAPVEREEKTMDKCSKCGTSCKAGISATYDDNNSVICDQCRGVERRDVIIDGVLVQKNVAWLPGENEAIFEVGGNYTVRRPA
jgi:hypothetical protein